VTDEDGREIGVAARGNDGDAVPGSPEDQPGNPLLEPEADGSRRDFRESAYRRRV